MASISPFHKGGYGDLFRVKEYLQEWQGLIADISQVIYLFNSVPLWSLCLRGVMNFSNERRNVSTNTLLLLMLT
jgi:hypothetical protein